MTFEKAETIARLKAEGELVRKRGYAEGKEAGVNAAAHTLSVSAIRYWADVDDDAATDRGPNGNSPRAGLDADMSYDSDWKARVDMEANVSGDATSYVRGWNLGFVHGVRHVWNQIEPEFALAL